MIYDRVTYCVIWILSVIVVALEFFLLTLGKIFWIVNASLLVSISAIGLERKVENDARKRPGVN